VEVASLPASTLNPIGILTLNLDPEPEPEKIMLP
jgi:hypothetical protein